MAKSFWDSLLKTHKDLEKLIDSGDKKNIENAMEKIETLLKDTGVNCRLILSVGKRYGYAYNSTPKVIELIFGLNQVKKDESAAEIENLFTEIPDFKSIPERWFFTKFNPPNQQILAGFEYKLADNPDFCIKPEDFKVKIYENNLLISISERCKDILIEKKKDVFVPKYSEVSDIILACIGEYHFISNIKSVSFVEPEDIDTSDFVKITDVQSLFKETEKCGNCHIPDFLAKLLACSKCKKTKYCSIKCQIKNLKDHKKTCG